MNLQTAILSLKKPKGRTGENRPMANHVRYAMLVPVLLSTLLLVIRPLGAQIDPNIKKAVDQINEITPHAMPQQTIRVGTFDGSTNHFEWALTETYTEEITLPPVSDPKPGEANSPKNDQRPRRVTAHVAEINSFNVKYEFEILNPPANFRLTLYLSDQNGRTVRKVAKLNTSAPLKGKRRILVPRIVPTGSAAIGVVTFNPYSSGIQTFEIQHSRGKALFSIKPRLQDELGAFVIPYMLVGIVYEPPGARSQASYEEASTVGTVVSLGEAHTSGLISTVQPDQLRDVFFGAAGLAFKGVGHPEVAAMLDVINKIIPKEYLITKSSNTTANSEAHGTFFSVADRYFTRPDDDYRYPGEGDVFLILTDVLFVYLVQDGRVHLAPIAYSFVRKWVASELQERLPSELAQKFLALNPHFNSLLMPSAMSQLQRVYRGRVSKIIGRNKTISLQPSRFKYHSTLACDVSGGQGRSFTREDYVTQASYSTTTETQIYGLSGYLASIQGLDDELLYSVTYSSSTQQVKSQSYTASIDLMSDPSEGAFEVDVYYDELFRTFLTLQGPPLDQEAAVAGVVVDERGLPMANQEVSLKIGGRHYVVFSDQNGNFQFRFRSLSKGPACVIAGKRTTKIAYRGKPIRNLKLLVRSSILGSKKLNLRKFRKLDPRRP